MINYEFNFKAGDNHHFHPTCARCTKCGDPFGDGEEMYLQGGAIWHPRCGPGPTENGQVLNGAGETNGHLTDCESRTGDISGREFDRMSSSGVSEMQVIYRPFIILLLEFYFYLICLCLLFVCVWFYFGLHDYFQFSMRSRTPSLNGSLYSPTSMSRKVSYVFSCIFFFYIS